MLEKIIFYGLIIIAIFILLITTGLIKSKKAPIQNKNETETIKNTESNSEIQSKANTEKNETNSEFKNIQKSISIMNIWLFIIAIALCIIAYCNFYDYQIKRQTINNMQESIEELNKLIQ